MDEKIQDQQKISDHRGSQETGGQKKQKHRGLQERSEQKTPVNPMRMPSVRPLWKEGPYVLEKYQKVENIGLTILWRQEVKKGVVREG